MIDFNCLVTGFKNAGLEEGDTCYGIIYSLNRIIQRQKSDSGFVSSSVCL